MPQLTTREQLVAMRRLIAVEKRLEALMSAQQALEAQRIVRETGRKRR